MSCTRFVPLRCGISRAANRYAPLESTRNPPCALWKRTPSGVLVKSVSRRTRGLVFATSSYAEEAICDTSVSCGAVEVMVGSGRQPSTAARTVWAAVVTRCRLAAAARARAAAAARAGRGRRRTRGEDGLGGVGVVGDRERLRFELQQLV